MNNKPDWDESELNENTISDLETARLALRWALDKIRNLQEEMLKFKQNMQEKNSQLSFLEKQVKEKNEEISRILRSHEDEMSSKRQSLEYEFKSKLDRIGEREKELESKISQYEDIYKDKEQKLLGDYRKKSQELRGRWATIESELWQLRQEQVLKQQEFDKVYAARIDQERKRLEGEFESVKTEYEKTYSQRVQEFEKRQAEIGDELKKQEAVLKWAKDSFQKDSDDREKRIKQKELELDKKLLEKNGEIDDYKIKIGLLQKQLSDYPSALKNGEEDIERYKQAMGSLEGVVRTLEDEKKNLRVEAEEKLKGLNAQLDQEKKTVKDIETEIPKRLKIAIEHERERYAGKLKESEDNYDLSLSKKDEEISFLSQNLRTFEETIKTFQYERDKLKEEVRDLASGLHIKSEEYSFKEKQLQAEYEVKFKVELEKHTRGVRQEMDSAQRIYEDNLRLKLEEIAHLRQELEGLTTDKRALQGDLLGRNKEIDGLKSFHLSEMNRTKEEVQAEYENKLRNELEKKQKIYIEEKIRYEKAWQDQLENMKGVVAQKDKGIEELRVELHKREEEKQAQLFAAKEKAGNDLEIQQKIFAETQKAYEDKILQLNRIVENARIEKEEGILLEKERLEGVYLQKEADIEDQLAFKNAEIARTRDKYESVLAEKEKELARKIESDMREIAGLKETAAGTAADMENSALSHAGEKRELENKIALILEDSSRLETEYQGKLDKNLKKAADEYKNSMDRKNAEIDGLKRAKEEQDELYRKALEDVRTRLLDNVSKMESLKKLSDERQEKINQLNMELSESKKTMNEKDGAHSKNLSALEKQISELKLQYEAAEGGAENLRLESQKKINDLMLKLRATEEQKAQADRELGDRNGSVEIYRHEVAKRESGMSQLKSDMENLKAEGVKTIEEYRNKELSHRNKIDVLENDLKSRDLLISEMQDRFRQKESDNSKSIENFRMRELEYKNESENLKKQIEDERKEMQLLLEDARKEYLSREKALMKEISDAKREIGLREARIDGLVNEIEKTKEEVRDYKENLENEKIRSNESALYRTGLESAVADKDHEIKDLANKITNLSAQMKHLEEEALKYKELCQNEKNKIMELGVYVKSLESATAEKEQYLKSVSDESGRQAREINALKNEIAQKESLLAELGVEVKRLAEIESKYLLSRRAMDELRKKLNLWKNK